MTDPTIPARPSLTKIVATVGPACDSEQALFELIVEGVDVFRLNTAHSDPAALERRLAAIRNASRQAGRLVAVLMDLAGPKIRLGELPGGQVTCTAGTTIRFLRGTTSTDPGVLTSSYAPLIDELKPGDRVMLADGLVALRVQQVDADSATCEVEQGGTVRSRQGVNLPGVKLGVPAMNEVDRQNALWGAKAGVDFISLSFVRRAQDLRQLKAMLQEAGSSAHVVAKIEKPEALDELEAIVEVADAVMVARGDLGVEIPIAQVPVVQKRIVATCNRHAKPVIVATQMLESMLHSRLPTRAEATDVANAILDGADACMLSGETAVGEYPREVVRTMHAIALATEPLLRERFRLHADQACAGPSDHPITDATVEAATCLAARLNAPLVLVVTASGATARSLARHRLSVPTLGVSDSEETLRRMCLYWGVIPLPGAPMQSTTDLLPNVIERARASGCIASGDRMIVIGGTGLKASRHNMVLVHEID